MYYQPRMLMGGSANTNLSNVSRHHRVLPAQNVDGWICQHKLVLCFQSPPCITSPACWWVDLSNTNLSNVSRHHRVLPAWHVDGWFCQHKLVLCFQSPPCITSPACWWVDLSKTNLSYVSRHYRVLPARHDDGWIYPTQTCPMFPGTTVYYQPGMLMGGSI